MTHLKTIICTLTLLLFFFLALPQNKVLAANQLVVASWNIKWFNDNDKSDDTSAIGKNFAAPNLNEYQERVATIVDAIANINPDILALQEIENEKVVEDLADELEDQFGLDYEVAFVQGADTYTGQDVAYLVRDDLTFTENRIPYNFSGNDDFKNLSKHLLLETTIDGQALELINIHLITNSNRRLKQARTLRSWVKDLDVPNSNIIVLGDFNVGLSFNSTTPTSDIGIIRGFGTTTTDDDLYDTQQNLTDRATHVSNRPLDRILLSPSLVNDGGITFIEVSTRRDLAIRGSEDGSRYVDYSKSVTEQDLSDHYPVIAIFNY